MASGKLAIGIGVAVVLGLGALVGVAAWNWYGHHEGMHNNSMMHRGGNRMHRDGGMMRHYDSGAHAQPGQMGEHHNTVAHHSMDNDAIDTRNLEPTGRFQDGVRVIDMNARQFAFEPSTVVVRQAEAVRLNVTNMDVAHGINIQGFGIDKRLPPNETVTVEFGADKPGQHYFHCSVFCGKGHGEMHGKLVVLTRTVNGQR